MRLKNYDYSDAGYYFITLCVKDGHEVLWDFVPTQICDTHTDVGAHSVRPPLSTIGGVVETAIRNVPLAYPNIKVDTYTIMPNHVHLILVIREENLCNTKEENGRTLCAPTISRAVKQMKEYVTKQIGFSIWQRSYHDRIIRNEAEYQRIRQYIDENPAKWAEDDYFVKHTPFGETPT